jgi:HAD superfamily hydrolase (TIGR01450 family)
MGERVRASYHGLRISTSTFIHEQMTENVTTRQLAERYDALLFDSYGVLVNEGRGLPGAAELVAWLESNGINYLIVTNDASRSIESRARRFIEQGVPVPAHRIVNSGILIPAFFRENNLDGAATVVFGSPDAVEYALEGGAEIVPPERMADARVFILADDAGFDWRPNLNQLLSVLNQKALDGTPVTLLLPNPDIIYSTGHREYSFAAAALADMIESAMGRLFGADPQHTFARLGKPHAPIFAEAHRRAGAALDKRSLVMIGDQLETDIAGANAYGIDSAVVTTGISQGNSTAALSALPEPVRPTYLLEDISPG